LLLGTLALAFQNCGPGGFQLVSGPLESTSTYTSTTPNDGGVTVTCNAKALPGRAPLRLLSNSEYDNIAADIFQSKTNPSIDAKFVLSAPGTSGFTNTNITSEPSAPDIDGIMVEKFWTAAGEIANEVIANKSQTGSFYSKTTSCASSSSIAESCYDTIVREVTLKVWRRPVSESAANNEFARLKAILKKGSSFDVGFKDFLKALLVSPNFLVVSWKPAAAMGAGQAFNLDAYQLASRLSFFLWQSAPDDQLLSLAKSGKLGETETLQNQVLRMLKDIKGKRFASVMTEEWLEVNNILGLGLTIIDNATLNAMIYETRLMFEDIVTNDLSFLNLLSADYSYMNKALADYYGVAFSGSDPSRFYKTSLASTSRRGVLTHASFLVATAGAPDKTHPVLRGKKIASKFGCLEVAPPPADLDTSLPPSLPSNATPAEILAVHTQKVQCAGCHRILDPYGLAMESFDTRGKWRTNYINLGGRPIDAKGTLPTGENFTTTQDFMSTLRDSADVKSCLVRNVMSLGLTRKVASADDRCGSLKISEVGMTPNSKFSDLIANIVTSRQFRMQSTEAP
jgi:hypothetical protein